MKHDLLDLRFCRKSLWLAVMSTNVRENCGTVMSVCRYEDPDVHWQKKFHELNKIINCQFVYGATVRVLLGKHLKYALTQFLPCFLKKMAGLLHNTFVTFFFFRKVGDSVTWIFPHSIMSYLISARVRWRFTLYIVSSNHVTRGIESSFAECRDPNSVTTHFSWRASRSYETRAFCCQSAGMFICWQLETVTVCFCCVIKNDGERKVTLRLTVNHFNLSCV